MAAMTTNYIAWTVESNYAATIKTPQAFAKIAETPADPDFLPDLQEFPQ